MTDFTRDNPDPPTRFRASQGQLGQQAAMQATRGRSPGRQAQHAGTSRRTQQAPSGRGLPQVPEQPEGDNRHLALALAHENSNQLGRDLPFGLWAQHSGYFSDIKGKGQAPFDWIED